MQQSEGPVLGLPPSLAVGLRFIFPLPGRLSGEEGGEVARREEGGGEKTWGR